MAARSSQRLGLLAAGDDESPVQASFRLRLRRLPSVAGSKIAAEAIDFRFPPAFLLLLHQGVGLSQRLEAVSGWPSPDFS